MSLSVALLLGLLSTAEQAPLAPPAVLGLPGPRGDADALALLETDTTALLDALDLDGTVGSRRKSAESLAAKAARKGIAPHQVLDRLALRVRVDRVEDCYRVFGALLDRYPPIAGSIDDYIAQPKENGYRSLHAAVLTPVGIAEFQVRTHGMHEHAEHGAAAHHRYKAAQA